MKTTICLNNWSVGIILCHVRRGRMISAVLLLTFWTGASADVLYDGTGNMVLQSGITGGGHIAIAGGYTLVGAINGASGPVSTLPSGYALFHGIPGPLWSEDEDEGEGENDDFHPGDVNFDSRMVLGEAIAYLAGWQQGSNPIAYAIRAAYLWQNGERYAYDPGASPPLCWILAP